MIWRVFRLFCLFVVVNILPLNAYAQDATALPEPTQAAPLIPDEFINLFDQLKCDYEEFARKQAVTAIAKHLTSNGTVLEYVKQYISQTTIDSCQLDAFSELILLIAKSHQDDLVQYLLPRFTGSLAKASLNSIVYSTSDSAPMCRNNDYLRAALQTPAGFTKATQIISDDQIDCKTRLGLLALIYGCKIDGAGERKSPLKYESASLRIKSLAKSKRAEHFLVELFDDPLDQCIKLDIKFKFAREDIDTLSDARLASIIEKLRTAERDPFGENTGCVELQTYAEHGGRKTWTAVGTSTPDQLQTADISIGNRILVGFNIALNTGEKPAQPWVDIAKSIVLSAFKSQTLSPEQLVEGKQLIADFPEEWPPNDYIRGPLKAIEAQLEKGAIEDAKRSASELKTYLRTYQYGDTSANAAIDKLVVFIDSVVSNQGRVAIKTSVPKCDSNELRIKDHVFRSDELLLALQVLGLAQDPEGVAICRSLTDKKTETNYKLAAVLCLLWNGADVEDAARIEFFVKNYGNFFEHNPILGGPDRVEGYLDFLENLKPINNPRSEQTIEKLIVKAVKESAPACDSMSASVRDANRQRHLQDLLLHLRALPLRTKSRLIFANQGKGPNRSELSCCAWTMKPWMNYCLRDNDRTSAEICLSDLLLFSGQISGGDNSCQTTAMTLSAVLDWPTVKKILDEGHYQITPANISILVSTLKGQKSKDRKKYLLKFLGMAQKGSALDQEIRAMLKEK